MCIYIFSNPSRRFRCDGLERIRIRHVNANRLGSPFSRNIVIQIADGIVTSDRLVDFEEFLREGEQLHAYSLFREEVDLNDCLPPDCDRAAVLKWLAGEIDELPS